jgi:hypothetical protein
MKTIIKVLLLLFLPLLFNSCKKEVPNKKTDYIGEWHAEYKTEILTIQKDGSGNWEYDSGTGDHDWVNGRVRFYNLDFDIKGWGKRKKFTVDAAPSPIPSSNPNFGAFSYWAKFNDMIFYRK